MRLAVHTIVHGCFSYSLSYHEVMQALLRISIKSYHPIGEGVKKGGRILTLPPIATG